MMIRQLLYLLPSLLLCCCTRSAPTATETARTAPANEPPTEEYYDPNPGLPKKSSWILESLNGRMLGELALTGNTPTLEIDLIENRARGYGGCNRFHGTVRKDNNRLVFGPLLSARMACAGMQVERTYLRMLQFPDLVYEYQPGKLVLRRDVRTVLVFRPHP